MVSDSISTFMAMKNTASGTGTSAKSAMIALRQYLVTTHAAAYREADQAVARQARLRSWKTFAALYQGTECIERDTESPYSAMSLMTVITYVKSEMLRTGYNMANGLGLGIKAKEFLDIAKTGVATVGNGF